MKKIKRNKFKINSKSLSLTKINPYFENKENFLPYKYKDPSFKTQFNGLLLQKDFHLLNLMNNRLKKVTSYKDIYKRQLPQIQSSEISKKKDIVFNSAEYERKQIINEYAKYVFSKLKKDFFNFNPYTSRNGLINYRKNISKGFRTDRNKNYNPNKFIMDFQRQIHQNNYRNWEKIKEEYEQRELSDPNKVDKFYDKERVWEILNENKKKFLKSINRGYYSNDKYQSEKKFVTLPANKSVRFFEIKNKKGKDLIH